MLLDGEAGVVGVEGALEVGDPLSLRQVAARRQHQRRVAPPRREEEEFGEEDEGGEAEEYGLAAAGRRRIRRLLVAPEQGFAGVVLAGLHGEVEGRWWW